MGNAGSVQGILAPVTVTSQPNLTALNVAGSANLAAKTVTLGNSPGADWGSISRLAPAAINFEWADVQSPVNTSTSPGKVVWIVNPNARAIVVGKVVKDDGRQIN